MIGFLAFIFMGFYTYFILRAIAAWRIGEKDVVALKGATAGSIGFSVIVPYRNEAPAIRSLLSDFNRTVSIPDDMEVLFIDDNSTDPGSQIILDWSTDIPHTSLKCRGQGKKEAIYTGIISAKYDRILTIDADVHLPQDWLISIARLLKVKTEPLVILPVIPRPAVSLIGRFATMEYMTLHGATLSSAVLKSPIMASGAGLIFDHALYSTDHHATASGDDMFILHRAKELSLDIGYDFDSAVAVEVDMPSTFSDFWSQRSRWSAKTRSYTDHGSLLVAWVVLLLNCMIAVMFIIGLFDHSILRSAVCFFAFKFILDLGFLTVIHRYYGRLKDLWIYPLFAIVYPFYIPTLAISSRFTSFDWKGRTHSE